MFALFALLCFVLALFGVSVHVNLVTLGLCFLAAHFLADPLIPSISVWRRK